MGICNVCGQKKQNALIYQDKLTCDDCVNSMEIYKYGFCRTQTTIDNYEVHLRTKHKPEEFG